MLSPYLTSCSNQVIHTSSGKAQAKVFTQDQKVLGKIQFENNRGKVKITGKFKGLIPNSKLGFHIHQKGVCNGDFKSSGGHFNPMKLPHGKPGISSHIGDLGNLVTDKDGYAFYEFESDQIELTGNHSIVGKAVIIHSGQDDMISQPSGDAGNRIGCGVLQNI